MGRVLAGRLGFPRGEMLQFQPSTARAASWFLIDDLAERRSRATSDFRKFTAVNSRRIASDPRHDHRSAGKVAIGRFVLEVAQVTARRSI
jgi:hypothetical protein